MLEEDAEGAELRGGGVTGSFMEGEVTGERYVRGEEGMLLFRRGRSGRDETVAE